MPTTSNFGWTTPADTDLVKDGAAAIRTLGNGIDTSLVDLKGGTTGQILSKNSNTDLDYTWVTPNVGDITEVQAGTGISVASGTGPIPVVTNTVATAYDAKGDLIVGTGADTFSRLAVGTNDYVLTAASGEATGLKWAAVPGSGKVLQVVSAYYTTSTSNSTSTYADTGLTATITPSAATSKIAVFVAQNGCNKSNGNTLNQVQLRLLRGASVEIASAYVGYTETLLQTNSSVSLLKLDDPNTTSAVTYKTQFNNPNNTASVTVQNGSSGSTIILMEIGA